MDLKTLKWVYRAAKWTGIGVSVVSSGGADVF